MPEPRENTCSDPIGRTDGQGQPLRRAANRGTPHDKNQKLDMRNKDNTKGDDRNNTKVQLLDSHHPSVAYGNRGPHLAPGHRSEEGKRDFSEMGDKNNMYDRGPDTSVRSTSPAMPKRKWEELATGQHKKQLERAQGGFSPNPPDKQRGVDDRYGPGETDQDTERG